jgi:hypothetical protein
MCTLSSFSYPHSRYSCPSVYPSLYKCALRLVWPVNSPTAVLSLDLFIARSSLALQGRRYLISNLDCRYPVQAAHLSQCFCSNCFLMRFLLTLKGIAANWFGGTSTAPSLASLSVSLPGIPWCLSLYSTPFNLVLRFVLCFILLLCTCVSFCDCSCVDGSQN